MATLGLARILQLFVVQFGMGVFFIYLAGKILSKNRSRLNISLSLLYIFTAIGLFINVIYSLIFNEAIVVVLNFITNFSLMFALIFLLSTNLIILKSEMIFTKKYQITLAGTYAIALLLMIVFYPLGGGVSINESTDWAPVWHLPLFIYFIIIITSFCVVPILYTAVKIYSKFEDEVLKKRWTYFIIGTVGLLIYLYGVYINNLIDHPMARFAFSLFDLTVFLWVYLIYYGIGRQIE